jgi:hypothetical protein
VTCHPSRRISQTRPRAVTTDPERSVELLCRARTRRNRLAGLLPQTVGFEVPLRKPLRVPESLYSVFTITLTSLCSTTMNSARNITSSTNMLLVHSSSFPSRIASSSGPHLINEPFQASFSSAVVPGTSRYALHSHWPSDVHVSVKCACPKSHHTLLVDPWFPLSY